LASAKEADNATFVKINLITLLLISSFFVLVILFQPVNVFVNEDYKTSHMTFWAWVGVLLSLPIAYVMVKPMQKMEANKIGQIMHLSGVWGVRLCIVFIIYLLFAAGGYLIPKHIVNFSADEKFKQTVIYRGYKLSSTPSPPPYQSGKFWIFNEYLLVEKNRHKIPVLINNWFGTNSFDYDAVESALHLKNSRMVLNGRKHARGYTYDSLTSE